MRARLRRNGPAREHVVRALELRDEVLLQQLRARWVARSMALRVSFSTNGLALGWFGDLGSKQVPNAKPVFPTGPLGLPAFGTRPSSFGTGGPRRLEPSAS